MNVSETRKKIREGMVKALRRGVRIKPDIQGEDAYTVFFAEQEIIDELIKSLSPYVSITDKDAELPHKGWVKEKYQYIVKEAQEHMLKAGWRKVYPLEEE